MHLSTSVTWEEVLAQTCFAFRSPKLQNSVFLNFQSSKNTNILRDAVFCDVIAVFETSESQTSGFLDFQSSDIEETVVQKVMSQSLERLQRLLEIAGQVSCTCLSRTLIRETTLSAGSLLANTESLRDSGRCTGVTHACRPAGRTFLGTRVMPRPEAAN